MALRSPVAQMKHNLMVDILARHLVRNGFLDVEAGHLKSYCPPEGISGSNGSRFIPDVVACKNGQKYIFEVETEDSLHSETTEEELRAFCDHSRKKDCRFLVLVPQKGALKAEGLLDGLKMEDVPILYI